MQRLQSLVEADFDAWMDLLDFVPSEDLRYLFWLSCRLCGVGNALCYGLEAGRIMLCRREGGVVDLTLLITVAQFALLVNCATVIKRVK